MNLTRWKGKVALVTGASAGIGFATATGLAKAGMRVAVTARNGGRPEELEASLDGAAVLPVTADLQQEAEVAGARIGRSTYEDHPEQTRNVLEKLVQLTQNDQLRDRVQGFLDDRD